MGLSYVNGDLPSDFVRILLEKWWVLKVNLFSRSFKLVENFNLRWVITQATSVLHTSSTGSRAFGIPTPSAPVAIYCSVTLVFPYAMTFKTPLENKFMFIKRSPSGRNFVIDNQVFKQLTGDKVILKIIRSNTYQHYCKRRNRFGGGERKGKESMAKKENLQ